MSARKNTKNTDEDVFETDDEAEEEAEEEDDDDDDLLGGKKRVGDESDDDEEEDDDDEDDEDDDEEEDDDDDDGADDYEPQLKYERLNGSLAQIFNVENGNFASALAVGDKFLALGTHLGYLYILDFEGHTNKEQSFRPHTESINDLSLDDTGDYIASVSNDGKVVVYSLYTTNEKYEYRHNRPMKTVALDPDYSKKNDKPIVFGGKTGKLVFHKKGWWSSKETVIHQGEGEIHAVRWKGSYIAWGNDQGVKIYDVSSDEKVAYIKRPANAPRADMFRCCLVWCDNPIVSTTNVNSPSSSHTPTSSSSATNSSTSTTGTAVTPNTTMTTSTPTSTNASFVQAKIEGVTSSQVVDYQKDQKLIIGWGKSVSIVLVKERKLGYGGVGVGTSGTVTTKKYVEVVSLFEVDFFICGVAPFLDTPNLLILAYDEDESDLKNSKKKHKMESPKPELRIFDPHGEELSCDVLSIKDHEAYFATDYRLEYSRSDKTFYILSQRDIVVAQPRDVDDHLRWLIQREEYEKALECAKENENVLKHHSVIKIGQSYLDYLLKKKDFKKAAQLVPNVAGQDKQLWEDCIYAFIHQLQFPVIIPKIPLDNPRLSDTIYEMKLNYYLMHDHEEFLKAVKEWPHDLYNIQHITTAVAEYLNKASNANHSQDNLSDGLNTRQLNQSLNPAEKIQSKVHHSLNQQQHNTLLNALAELYMHGKQYDKALGIYFQLRRPEIFQFIEQHQLFASVQNKVSLLLEEFDEEKALKLLINNTDNIAVDQVVQQLSNKREHLLKYLDSLFHKNVRSAQKHHLLQVELYAQYDTEKLLNFLEHSQSYNIEGALKICKEQLQRLEQIKQISTKKQEKKTEKADKNTEHDKDSTLTAKLKMLYRAVVYLLGRMGNTSEALHLIIDKLQDINEAISFVETQKDSELWQDLIDRSLTNADFISGLLDHISEFIADHIDPIALIKKIPDHMEIEGLKYKLARIISDYSLQMTLQKGCEQILASDTKDLSQDLYRQQRKGAAIKGSVRCALCTNPLKSSREESVIFFCGHSYHTNCFYPIFFRQSQNDASTAQGEMSAQTGTTTIANGVTIQSSISNRKQNPFEGKKIHCLFCHKKEKVESEVSGKRLQTKGDLDKSYQKMNPKNLT